MHLEDACSQHFTFEMLFHCGETWQRIQCPNLPEQTESWLAYRELATHILDPLVEAFGPPIADLWVLRGNTAQSYSFQRLPRYSPHTGSTCGL